MRLPSFDHLRPEDLDEAMAASADGATLYCGGTELLAAMAMGLLRPDRLATLRAIPSLRDVTLIDGTLRIGATATHRDVARSDLVVAAAPLLADVARRVGNVRVRSTGTIGGNLAFAEPRSDVSCALAALDAQVVVSNATTTRSQAIEDFIVGPYETTLDAGEVLVAVELAAAATDVAVYHKLVVSERPIVGVAITRRRSSGMWRLVVGAVGSTMTIIDTGSLDAVDAAIIAGDVDVSADLSGSERYKRAVTRVVIERSRSEAIERAAGVPS